MVFHCPMLKEASGMATVRARFWIALDSMERPPQSRPLNPATSLT